ncbi:MAG TPA: PLP-dependent aminotransferase family protein [Clostridia bacterium]|nr:PLP-dependent aminotransferase family protein [Clostridia bacterium]
MTITIAFNKEVPLYKQLYGFIKNEIKEGNIKVGDKMPSKRSLSSHLKVSQNTIETAYQQLAAEGYIKAVPKSGFYVCEIEDLPAPSEIKPRCTLQNIKELKPKQYQYDFRTNTVDTAYFPFSTWAKISKEIIHDENRELLKTTHPQGDYHLRESISKYLHHYRGVNCLPEQIIIGAGTEYLFGLIIQLLGRNRVYAIENPGYSKTHKILKSYNANLDLIGLDEDGLKVDDLARSNSNVVYITPSHHFPLGIIMPITRRMQLLKWANQSEDRFIIEDDYDSEFRFNGCPIPALQGLDTNEKVIYISTFSNSIAPSIRISYIVLPMLLLQRYNDEYSFYSSTVSRFEQYTLYRFIQGGHFERHLNRMRNVYRSRKDTLIEEIKKLSFGEKIEIIGENAGLHLMLRVQGYLTENELVTRAEKVGIKLYGLSEYYLAPDEAMPNNVVVIGYSNYDKSEIAKAVHLLNEAWT